MDTPPTPALVGDEGPLHWAAASREGCGQLTSQGRKLLARRCLGSTGAAADTCTGGISRWPGGQSRRQRGNQSRPSTRRPRPGPGKRAHPRLRARPPRWRGAAPSAVQARRRRPAASPRGRLRPLLGRGQPLLPGLRVLGPRPVCRLGGRDVNQRVAGGAGPCNYARGERGRAEPPATPRTPEEEAHRPRTHLARPRPPPAAAGPGSAAAWQGRGWRARSRRWAPHRAASRDPELLRGQRPSVPRR